MVEPFAEPSQIGGYLLPLGQELVHQGGQLGVIFRRQEPARQAVLSHELAHFGRIADGDDRHRRLHRKEDGMVGRANHQIDLAVGLGLMAMGRVWVQLLEQGALVKGPKRRERKALEAYGQAL